MSELVTYAYTLLRSENTFEFSRRLKDLAALQRYVERQHDSTLLYSDYDVPPRSTLTHEDTMAGAGQGIVVCPVTEALIRRHGIAAERMADGGLFTLEGAPVGQAASGTPGPAAQPLSMLNQATFQQVFEHYPDAPALLLDAGIEDMAGFREKWVALPEPLVSAIGLHHLALAARRSITKVPSPNLAETRQVAVECLRIARAFPPWVISWDNMRHLLDARASRVMMEHAPSGPIQLGRLSVDALLDLRNFGRRSASVLFQALTDIAGIRDSDIMQGLGAPSIPGGLGHGEIESGFAERDVLTPAELLAAEDLPSTASGLIEDAIDALPAALRMVGITPCTRFEIAAMRLGGDTLEKVGSRCGITRERVRQLEPKVGRWIQQHYHTVLSELKERNESGQLDQQHVPLYRSLKGAASLTMGLERLLADSDDTTDTNVRDWLALVVHPSTDSQRISGTMFTSLLAACLPSGGTFSGHFGVFSHGFTGASAPKERIILPLPEGIVAKDIERYVKEDWLHKLAGMTRETSLDIGIYLLRQQGLPPAVAKVLTTFALTYWLTLDEQGNASLDYLIPTPKRERQAALDIIKQAKRPLHIVDDIFNKVRPDETGRSRPDAVVRSWLGILMDEMYTADPDYPVYIGSSHVATINQLGLANANLKECAAYMAMEMACSPEREFSVRELADSLQASNIPDFSWPSSWPGYDRITTANIAHVILVNQRCPNTRNMGRFVWKHGPWADRPDTEGRTQIAEIHKNLIRERGCPVRARDLGEAVAAVRGRSFATDQIIEVNGIVYVEGRGKNALYWDSDLGAPPTGSDTSAGDDNTGVTDASGDEATDVKHVAPTASPASSAMGTNVTLSQAAEDACRALFEVNQMPVVLAEMIAAVEDVDGPLDDAAAVTQLEGITHLQEEGNAALYWDATLDDWDEGAQAQVGGLQQAVIREVKASGSTLFIAALDGLFRDFHDQLASLNEMEMAMLLARHPAMVMGNTDEGHLYVTLADIMEGQA